MRRILVPLDGSQLGESILPDARRLAGQEGQLVLVHVVGSSTYDPEEEIYRFSFAIRAPPGISLHRT